ncbi:MAG: peptidoglycan DD-metalloendopeptidase family protein [Bacteroidota bacterium]
MASRICILLVASLLLGAVAHVEQRGDREIKKKEKELQKLRTDIEAFEKKIRESERKEKSTLEHLDDLERQSNLIRRLVQSLREEEVQLTSDIRDAKISITQLENQLQFLKSHYAGYVRSVYKNGRVYDVELLFSSKSINQLYIRIEYLKRFSDQRLRDMIGIDDKKMTLEQENEYLQTKLATERLLLTEKTREEGNLRRKYAERQSVLSKIRKDKRNYRKELARKSAAVGKIEQLIADLIEKERIRKEREAAAKHERELAEARARLKSTPPVLPKPEIRPSIAFDERKGKLRWPVARGSVQSKFGNQIHPVLKTITQNTGIDISTPSGSDVYAVADGEVSVLSFIPGFGNVLILNHFNGYRTVYAHLSDVVVAESQPVKEGMVIAKSGDTVSGPVLHFEIWKERDKQNPEGWLAKR